MSNLWNLVLYQKSLERALGTNKWIDQIEEEIKEYEKEEYQAGILGYELPTIPPPTKYYQMQPLLTKCHKVTTHYYLHKP